MKSFLLIVLQLAASGSDAYITDRNQHRAGFHELNPIARPFVKSRTGTVAYFSVATGIELALPKLLKRKHPRIAEIVAEANITDHAISAAYSAPR